MAREGAELLNGLLSSRGRLIVVSGPSGVGKDAVLAALLGGNRCPGLLERCVTATTRAPRTGEIDGRDYLFLDRAEFENRISRGYFLEHALYNQNYYGTPSDAVERIRAGGVDVILKIEVRGARQIKAIVPNAVLVFLAPPSWEELERRLKGRGTGDEMDVEHRLSIARQELAEAPNYTYMVLNDAVEHAADSLRAIILAERCRIRPTDDGR